MSDAKRFVEMGHTDMREWSGGPWVRASDYDALAADNAALRVEIAQWRAERDALAAELAGVAKDCLRWHSAYMDLKYPNGAPPFPGAQQSETPVAQSLLRAASKQAPPGCYCTARCAAPVIMGRQTPCRDPEKAARFQSEPPGTAPSTISHNALHVENDRLRAALYEQPIGYTGEDERR